MIMEVMGGRDKNFLLGKTINTYNTNISYLLKYYKDKIRNLTITMAQNQHPKINNIMGKNYFSV